jgi:hypothetical protein
MRYISIFTHQKKNDRPPTEAEMASMGKLIEDGMKKGWLIATEGVSFGQAGVRIHKPEGGDVVVTDGPFAEAKEVIGGYALMRAGSKAEVVELCREFLKVAGQGTCEVHELFEAPPHPTGR